MTAQQLQLFDREVTNGRHERRFDPMTGTWYCTGCTPMTGSYQPPGT